jgi:hypothetical protein
VLSEGSSALVAPKIDEKPGVPPKKPRHGFARMNTDLAFLIHGNLR